MGLVFDLDAAQREQLTAVLRELEQQLDDGRLPTSTVE